MKAIHKKLTFKTKSDRSTSNTVNWLLVFYHIVLAFVTNWDTKILLEMYSCYGWVCVPQQTLNNEVVIQSCVQLWGNSKHEKCPKDNKRTLRSKDLRIFSWICWKHYIIRKCMLQTSVSSLSMHITAKMQVVHILCFRIRTNKKTNGVPNH